MPSRKPSTHTNMTDGNRPDVGRDAIRETAPSTPLTTPDSRPQTHPAITASSLPSGHTASIPETERAVFMVDDEDLEASAIQALVSDRWEEFSTHGIVKLVSKSKSRAFDAGKCLLKFPKGHSAPVLEQTLAPSPLPGVALLNNDSRKRHRVLNPRVVSQTSLPFALDNDLPRIRKFTKDPSFRQAASQECLYSSEKGGYRKTFSAEAVRSMEIPFWNRLDENTDPVSYYAERDFSITRLMVEDNPQLIPDLSAMDDILGRLVSRDEIDFEGISTPYIYVGTPGTFFPWHLEDVNFLSLNLMLVGGPKVWYGIRRDQIQMFMAVVQEAFKDEYKACDLFLRHKTCLLSPAYLLERGLDLTRLVQLPGEIIITMPLGAHSGVNIAFNVNEAVNFATSEWEPYGQAAQMCSCDKDRADGWRYMSQVLAKHPHITSCLAASM